MIIICLFVSGPHWMNESLQLMAIWSKYHKVEGTRVGTGSAAVNKQNKNLQATANINNHFQTNIFLLVGSEYQKKLHGCPKEGKKQCRVRERKAKSLLTMALDNTITVGAHKLLGKNFLCTINKNITASEDIIITE